MKTVLRLTQAQRAQLQRHLLPGDGLEAAAVASCGRAGTADRPVLVVHRIHPIPYQQCERSPDFVTWPLGTMRGLLDEVTANGQALVKFHSHPGGYPAFSELDDASDAAALGAALTWADDGKPHGSIIMLPDGKLLGRVLDARGGFTPMARITVVGDHLSFFDATSAKPGQVFGEGTRTRMESLRVGVVGCSGTGSVVIEQLLRHGVGELVVVDGDIVEHRNLNRILNSRLADAEARQPKVELAARTAGEMGNSTVVHRFATPVQDRAALASLALCDVVFGCVDSAEGRQVLNRLAAYYLLPFFDLGVRIDADGEGGVSSAYGVVHYLKPDGSTLMERGVVTQARLRAEGLARTDPAQYADEIERGYIRGTNEQRPAVITLNMMVAAHAVMELLERLHPFRLDEPAAFASLLIDVRGGGTSSAPELANYDGYGQDVGRGDCAPYLGMSSL